MRASRALRRILATTDFSAASLRAVRRAALLAANRGAELRLLHVMAPASRLAMLTPRGAANRSAMNRAAQTALQRVADQCARTAGIHPSLSVVAGAAHRTIARVAADDRGNPIVVGAAGEHERLLGRLTGGTAQRLHAELPANLLVVRRAARRSELAMRRELRSLGRTQIPRNRFAGAQILRGDLREQLPAHARRIAADCLTSGSPRRSMADRRPLATFGDVTRQVVDRAAMDVLVVR